MKDGIITVGFCALTAIATAGWMRQTQPAPAPAPVMQALPVMQYEPGMPALPMGVRSAVYEESGVPVYRPRTVTPRPVLYQAPQRAVSGATMPQRHVEDAPRVVRASHREPVVTKQRSRAKSVAIVAGGAGAGAAIGAAVGGGKGAAIGAVSGGTAGLVYDRMTANKREPVNDADRSVSNATYTPEPDRRERSTLKSVGIIAGSAGAGAAIGGAAGGGKGAAIGAATGGAAGLIYDRMTRR